MSQDLNTFSVDELGRIFPIFLKEYDPSWETLFESEKRIIKENLDNNCILRIEHIGSTSIKGMFAKPTIDILLEINESVSDRCIIDNLTDAGYSYIPKPENPPPHMMFAKGYSPEGYSGQTYHIHVRYPDDHDEIIFRDYLMQHPGETKAYIDLKIKLASEFVNDREKYTCGKSDFVRRITRAAREESAKI